MASDDQKISTNAYVSVGLVLALAAGAVAYGRQYQRIDELDSRTTKLEQYTDGIATIKEQVRALTVTVGEVRSDVKEIKERQVTPTKR